MKVLVTGASGFLGRHLLALLEEHPTYEPVGLCRRPERLGSIPVEVERADLVEHDDLAGLLRGFGAVIHAAGAVSHDPRDARAMYASHVTGTERLLTAAREAGVKRVVLLSTSGTVAVSETAQTLDETAPSPLAITKGWPYYRSKLFAEQAALDAAGGDLDVVVLNPSLLLGPVAGSPYDRRASSTAGDGVLLPLLRGELPLSPSGGISFVDVRDVAHVAVHSLGHGHPSRRYLLAGANWTFADFYGRAARIAGCRAPGFKAPGLGIRLLKFLPGRATDRLPASPVELEMASHTWWADSARAAAELGFCPREPLETLAEAVGAAQRSLQT